MKKIIFLPLGIIAIFYSLSNDTKYIYTLISAIISLALIVLFLTFIRNVTLPKQLFRNRFFWYNPLIILSSVALFSTLKYLLKDVHLNSPVILYAALTGYLIGLIWGYREYTRIKKYNKENCLVEYIEMINIESNQENKGILVLNKDQNICFVEKDVYLFKFKKSEIKRIEIKKEYLIFPTSLNIETTNGINYDLISEFPYVWKKELLK